MPRDPTCNRWPNAQLVLLVGSQPIRNSHCSNACIRDWDRSRNQFDSPNTTCEVKGSSVSQLMRIPIEQQVGGSSVTAGRALVRSVAPRQAISNRPGAWDGACVYTGGGYLPFVHAYRVMKQPISVAPVLLGRGRVDCLNTSSRMIHTWAIGERTRVECVRLLY